MRSGSQRKYRLRFFARLLFAAAAIVLLVGAVVSWRQHRYNQNVIADRTTSRPAAVGAGSPPNTNSAPDTTQPNDESFNRHTVRPDEPRYLFIPGISVRAMIKPVGVTADNRIAAPRNVHDVGWYTGGAKPGQPGAVVLDGHISSYTTHGVFYNLKKLRPGDRIELERGGGTILAYKIVQTKTYAAQDVDMTAVLKPITAGKPGLNIISCTGSVIKGTNDFDKRIVVFAEQL